MFLQEDLSFNRQFCSLITLHEFQAKIYFSCSQYAVLLIFVFILEIGAGAYAYGKKDSAVDKLKVEIKKAVTNSYEQLSKSDQALTKGVDWFQKNVSPRIKRYS